MRFGFGWAEAAAMALYCGVLALMIPHHEPWGDEAQAWMLMRDNTAWQIIAHRMHYEGTPPLWHLLLRMFYLAHGTFQTMGWFGAAFASAGVFVLLRWSPFPLIVRLLLPFTFFLQYQYAVIARSYTLFALLVFTVCALFPYKQKAVGFALTAGLLANLSLQGMIVAAVFAIMYLVDLYGERKLYDFGREHGRRRSLLGRQLTAAGLLFCAMVGFGVYTALPAPDVNFAVTGSTSTGPVHRALVRMFGETAPISRNPVIPDPPMPGPAERAQPRFISSPAGWMASYINHRDVDANGFVRPQTTLRSVLEFFVSIASQATWPVATSNLLACVFLGLMFAWLWARRGLRLLLPWVALMLFGQFVWVADHHVGMLFLVLLAAIWIARERRRNRPISPALDLGFKALLTAVVALQIGWSAFSIGKDLRGAYDPGRETAAYLLAHPVTRTAALHYWSESMQPYFGAQPFFNVPSRYWIWSLNANPDPHYRDAVDAHPDRIVDSIEVPGPGQMRNQWVPLNHAVTPEELAALPWDYSLKYIHDHGYVETHRFCGTRFVRMSSSFTDCDLILERVE